MKTHIFKKSAIAMAAIMILGPCSDLFDKDDIKSNPNNPTQVGLTQQTTGALVGLATLHEDTDNRIASMWGGQLAGTSRQHLTFQLYQVSSGTFGWSNYYNTAINMKQIQEAAAAVSAPHLGLGQVGEALVFAKLAGLYGDVPYTEALDLVNYPTPKYDGEVALYKSLIALLDKAVVNLGGKGTITGDFFYGGNPKLWAAAARTLQARLYLHLKDYPNAIASAKSGIASPEDDMLVPHGSAQQVDLNLNYDFFVNSRPGDTAFDPSLGAYLPAFMCTDITTGKVGELGVAQRNAKTDETNLFSAFFGYEAVQEGDGTWDPNVNDGVFQQNSFSPVLTYYENQLILAEAYARQNTAAADANAIAALNSVRTGLASGTIFGATYKLGKSVYAAYDAADFASGGTANPFTGPNAGMTEQEALLREIASEKFVILLMQYEAFSEVRRLAAASPAIALGVPINAGSKFPERFIYPQNEINTNPNTPSPAPDQFTKLPVFQ